VRPSERAFHLADIVARPAGLLITIRRSKTDQDGLRQMIGVVRGASPLTDPLSALSAWLNVRPQGDGPLFTRLDAHGTAGLTPIGARTVSRMLQARGRAAGLGHLRSPGTHSGPVTRPPRLPTAPASPASQRRPDTATSRSWSGTTSDPSTRSRRRPVATSDSDAREDDRPRACHRLPESNG
jgi:hypothetical protein